MTLKDAPPPHDIWNGQQLWVGRPATVSNNGGSVVPIPGFGTFTAAQLQCEPLCRDWSTVGEIHAFHEGVIPGTLYNVEVVDCTCDLSDKGNYSPALAIKTPKWGDVLEDTSIVPPGPPNGVNTITDTLGVILAFGSTSNAPRKARADLEPNCVDVVINITDALQCLNGFNGLPYSASFPPKVDNLCDSPCGNPLPPPE